MIIRHFIFAQVYFHTCPKYVLDFGQSSIKALPKYKFIDGQSINYTLVKHNFTHRQRVDNTSSKRKNVSCFLGQIVDYDKLGNILHDSYSDDTISISSYKGRMFNNDRYAPGDTMSVDKFIKEKYHSTIKYKSR